MTLLIDNQSYGNLVEISQDYFANGGHPQGRWFRRDLPQSTGDTEFLTADICSGLSVTHSLCQFESHYRSVIRYSEPTTLLVFGLQGFSSFGFSDTRLPNVIRPGDVWLIHLGDEPLYRFTPASLKTEMVVVKYATERLAAAFEHDFDSGQFMNSGISRLGHQESPHFWVEGLLNNCLNSGIDRLMAESQALELIAKWLIPTVPVCNARSSGVSQHDMQRLRQVMECLTGDLARTPSLKELARTAGMSHTTLNRYFKKVYGSTVFNWLRTYRLERSRAYLRDHARSITHIAFQCGFSSASHFSQAFRQQYDCTPIEFRQRMIN